MGRRRDGAGRGRPRSWAGGGAAGARRRGAATPHPLLFRRPRHRLPSQRRQAAAGCYEEGKHVRWWLTEDRGWRRKKGCGGYGSVSSLTSARCRPRTCSSPLVQMRHKIHARRMDATGREKSLSNRRSRNSTKPDEIKIASLASRSSEAALERWCMSHHARSLLSMNPQLAD